MEMVNTKKEGEACDPVVRWKGKCEKTKVKLSAWQRQRD